MRYIFVFLTRWLLWASEAHKMGLSIQYGFGRVRFARLFPHRRRQHWFFPGEEGRSCLDWLWLCLKKQKEVLILKPNQIYFIQLYNNSLILSSWIIQWYLMCKIVTNACFIVKVVNELLFSFYKKKNQPPIKQKLKVHTLWVIYKVKCDNSGSPSNLVLSFCAVSLWCGRWLGGVSGPVISLFPAV